MDEEIKDLEPSPEEQKAEEEATKEVQDDELRSSVAEQYGIDPENEDQQELLEKLTNKEKEHRSELSTAIKQKRTWRERFKSTVEKPKEIPKEKNVQKKDNADIVSIDDIRAEIRAEFEERDLAEIGLPDELKDEVKEIAKVRKISVREASELPYIKYRADEITKEKKILDASKKPGGKGGNVSINDLDLSKPLDPDDFKTETGGFDVEAWDKAQAARERWKAEQRK